MNGTQETDDQRIFGQINVGPGRELRVTLNTYKGKQRIHLRLYVHSPDVGDFIPTRKGASIAAGNIDSVIEALQAARAALPSQESSQEPSQSQPRAKRRETVRLADNADRDELAARAHQLRAEGRDAPEIAAALNVSRATAYRLLRTAQAPPPADRDDSGASGAPAAPGAACVTAGDPSATVPVA